MNCAAREREGVMRKLMLSVVVALLAACSPAVGQGSSDNRATLLFHAIVNDHDDASQVGIWLAPRDRSGRYKVLRGFVVGVGMTGQAKLPAGQYAVVEAYSMKYNLIIGTGNTYRFRASEPKLEGIMLDPVYDKAIALFTLKPGEVVDVGSLRVRGNEKNFSAQVGPLPPDALKKLAEKEPALYKARVVRPMVVVR
jgi:hypothetical protein